MSIASMGSWPDSTDRKIHLIATFPGGRIWEHTGRREWNSGLGPAQQGDDLVKGAVTPIVWSLFLFSKIEISIDVCSCFTVHVKYNSFINLNPPNTQVLVSPNNVCKLFQSKSNHPDSKNLSCCSLFRETKLDYIFVIQISICQNDIYVIRHLMTIMTSFVILRFIRVSRGPPPLSPPPKVRSRTLTSST